MNFKFIIIGLLLCSTSFAQQLKLTIHQTLKNTQYDFLGIADIKITGESVSGKIIWTIKKIDPKDRLLQSKIGATGTEFVSGTYDSINHKMSFGGVSKNDPSNILALDVYQLTLTENGSVSGTTRGTGNWNGIVYGEFNTDSKEMFSKEMFSKEILNKTTQPELSSDDQECIKFIQNRAEKISDYVKLEKSVAQYKRSDNYRIINRNPDKTPKTIRFDMVYAYMSTPVPEICSVDVLLKNKVPYIVYPTGHGNAVFSSSFPIDYKNLDYPYPKMTPAMAGTINMLSDAYLKEALAKEVNDPSYLKVLSIQNGYPKDYNILNCLRLVYYMENDGHIEMTKTPGYGIVQTHEFVADGESERAAYQNMTGHPVVIKGIYCNKLKPNNLYEDKSIVLKPGEIIPLSSSGHFKAKCDLVDLYVYDAPQYYGDFGIIKKTNLIVYPFTGEVRGKLKR